MRDGEEHDQNSNGDLVSLCSQQSRLNCTQGPALEGLPHPRDLSTCLPTPYSFSQPAPFTMNDLILLIECLTPGKTFPSLSLRKPAARSGARRPTSGGKDPPSNQALRAGSSSTLDQLPSSDHGPFLVPFHSWRNNGWAGYLPSLSRLLSSRLF